MTDAEQEYINKEKERAKKREAFLKMAKQAGKEPCSILATPLTDKEQKKELPSFSFGNSGGFNSF